MSIPRLTPFNQTSSQRLASLYADFSTNRHANPIGFTANIAWWTAVLEQASVHALLPPQSNALILSVGDQLLDALKLPDGKRPSGMGYVVVSAFGLPPFFLKCLLILSLLLGRTDNGPVTLSARHLPVLPKLHLCHPLDPFPNSLGAHRPTSLVESSPTQPRRHRTRYLKRHARSNLDEGQRQVRAQSDGRSESPLSNHLISSPLNTCIYIRCRNRKQRPT